MDERTEIMLDNIGMTYKTDDNRDVTALTSVTLDIKKVYRNHRYENGCKNASCGGVIASRLRYC